MKDRLYWIDAVRSFACLCGICTQGRGMPLIAVSNYLSVGGASILFFMISGALILNKEKKLFPFIKTRLLRIFLPCVIWSIICLIIKLVQVEIDFNHFWIKVMFIPFGPQVSTYWFIYVIFGIYLLTPILSSWLAKCSKRDVEQYLIIWSVILFLPYLCLIDNRFKVLITSYAGYLYYFYGFSGFAVLGYYLRNFVSIERFQLKHIIVFLAVFILPFLLYRIPDIPHSIIQNRMSINVVLLACCYFLLIKHIKLPAKLNIAVYNFAQHSFGIYLVHILVMRDFLWPILQGYNIHYAIQIPLITVLTAVLSYIIVHIISKLPYSKYIIGL